MPPSSSAAPLTSISNGIDCVSPLSRSETSTVPPTVLPAASFGMSTITHIGFTPFAATSHSAGVMRLTLSPVFALQRSLRAFSEATHTWNG